MHLHLNIFIAEHQRESSKIQSNGSGFEPLLKTGNIFDYLGNWIARSALCVEIDSWILENNFKIHHSFVNTSLPCAYVGT